MPSSDTNRWNEVLDLLELRLDAYRACVTGGEVPEPYHLPKDLGPLPRELEARARALLELNRGVEGALEARRDRLALALRDFKPSAPAPAFVDRRV